MRILSKCTVLIIMRNARKCECINIYRARIGRGRGFYGEKSQHERKIIMMIFQSKIQYCSKFNDEMGQNSTSNVEKTNKIRTIAKFNDRYHYYFVFIRSFGFTQPLFFLPFLVIFGLIHHQNHSK